MSNLLPNSLQQPHIRAMDEIAANALDGLPVEAVLIYMIDTVDSSALPYLAEQFDVLGVKGYGFATTDAEKRDVIRNAIELHRFKGTAWSIKEALSRIGYPNAEIIEGVGQINYLDGTWNLNGSRTLGSQGHWAYFQVQFNAQNFATISGIDADAITKIIMEYKNARSHLWALAFYNNIVDVSAPTEAVPLGMDIQIHEDAGYFLNGNWNLNGSVSLSSYAEIVTYQVVPLDTDAQAFFTASGITSATEQNAVNQLVVDLKVAGLWAKMLALYPMVGGTLDTCKFNLKNPLNADSAYRLNFVGGWAFSTTGAQPNGANAYANTYFVPATHNAGGLNDMHMSYYSRTTNTYSAVDMGAFTRQPITSAIIDASNFTLNYGNNVYLGLNSSNVLAGASKFPTRGLFGISRTTSGNIAYFKNATVEYNVSNSSQLLTNAAIYIGARNDAGVPMYHTNRQCAFASIGKGLSDAEIATLNTIVTAFQTALGRNV